jgi:hypothetical protein
MKIICHYRNDAERGLLDPVLEKGGRRFVIRLWSGDVCDPVSCCGSSDWFGPNYPRHVVRFFCKLPILPFIAWKWPFMDRAGYIGFKPYGADSPAYKNWMPAEDVYDGSQALCFSIRPFARM